MSLNKVLVDSQQTPPSPILFAYEKLYFSAPCSLEYDNAGGYPGRGQQLLIQNGGISVSNIRILYLPTLPTASFQSFSIPLQNLEDGKVSEGWLGFGASSYSGSVKSLQDEGFTNDWGVVKFTFQSSSHGPEFKNIFDHLRSRLGVAPVQYVEPLPVYDGPPDGSSDVTPGSSSAGPVDCPPSYN